ncbi:MAG: hypothetical protein KKE50_07355 [Nanoarchaeota archaeon]|nr:hypothetical protein [Nanoarchaeota archaeon]
MKKVSTRKLVELVASVWEIRKIPVKVTNEEIDQLPLKNRPFLYASGNWGPGYGMVKALASRKEAIETTVGELANKVANKSREINFVAGNVTGGVIPGWVLSNKLEKIIGKLVEFVYVGGSRTGSGKDASIITVDKIMLKGVICSLYQAIYGKARFDFIAGMAPGGMVPGYELSRLFKVPFVYVREARKKGGQKEMITGTEGNPYIKKGDTALVIGQIQDIERTSAIGCEILKDEGYNSININDKFGVFGDNVLTALKGVELIRLPLSPAEMVGVDVEELVNFAQTTCNSAQALRDAGCKVNLAATILYYDNPHANEMLKDNGIEIVYLFTLPQLLDEIERQGVYPTDYVQDFRDFLAHPLDWQAARGLKPVKGGGTL